jgi:hypothetical protein
MVFNVALRHPASDFVAPDPAVRGGARLKNHPNRPLEVERSRGARGRWHPPERAGGTYR